MLRMASLAMWLETTVVANCTCMVVTSLCVCYIVMCLFGGGSALVNSVVFLLGCGCCGVDWGVACVYFFTVSL